MPWTRHHSKTLILIFGLGGLAVLAGLALLLGGLGWFDRPAAIIEVGIPGAATGDSAELRIGKAEADLLSARMIKLLQDEETGLLAENFQLAGRYGRPEAVRSDLYLASDQLNFGAYLLEQGWQEDFQSWWQTFAAVYVLGSGLVRTDSSLNDPDSSLADDFWRVNLMTLRLLAQSCTVWPDNSRQAAMQRLSDQLLDLAARGIEADYAAEVPTTAPTADPAATPTPKPTISPDAAEPGKTREVLRLATLDLFTMQKMAALDNRWQTIYEEWLPIVESGYINDDLPLYAFGYVQGQAGYLNYNGVTPSVDTGEALMTILRLCEIGRENPRSLSWLRDQLYNNHAIYESYHIAQGQPTSVRECIAGYAIVARIARIKGDSDLYDAAVSRLLWHQASSQTSAALSAIFREGSDGLIFVHACDNTLALLAMR